MVNGYNKSYEGIPNPRWEPGGSGLDTIKRCGINWLLAEEARLEKPITCDQFSKSFYERLFSKMAQKEMEE